MRFVIVALGMSAVGCSAGAPPNVNCATDVDCAAAMGTPVCDATGSICAAGTPRAPLIGTGDGTAASVGLTVVVEPDAPRESTGLAFHPQRPNELWIVNRKDDSVVTVYDAGTPTMRSERRKDPDAAHFMHRPPGLAFAGNNSFAVCGEGDNGGNDFMGPAVFSADPTIFAKATPGGLGSHLDMLHASPFCTGITHERDNVYWIFDGMHGALVRYDFHEFHEPGAEDHSDGEIQFFVQNTVKRVAGIPSGLAFNPDDGQLYVSDTGNQRLVKLDTRTGTPGAALDSQEPSIPVQMDNTMLTELVPPGTLQAPSGMLLRDGVLYVADNATSRIHAFDLTGHELRYLDTGLAAGSLAGITAGPDGRIWFVDLKTSRVYRIDTP